MNQFAAVHTLRTNVVDFVCSVNVVVAVNAPMVKRPAAKAVKVKAVKAKAMAINNHANDVNSVHVVKAADSMDHAGSAIVRVDRVAMKMEKSSTVTAMVLAQPVKVLVKVREAKMDIRNASVAISADHHADHRVDHVAVDHHALAKATTATPKEAMRAKMEDQKDNEELDGTIETAHPNKAAPIK